ncbi:hypothetical protein RFI_23165 [Reticulomyxa filosa]|uniref:Uncharacterized protein n=1 Tax=Reticulomyxa filosa TaxID=46433 RepID=X6MK08_RETFI|nr:hypothetical protein RFI_23165 [Reticulomyxa filosa]|eukprot:ETO14204.1 hypothetical protein RFI_23165 [Reticulomyxa filosa]
MDEHQDIAKLQCIHQLILSLCCIYPSFLCAILELTIYKHNETMDEKRYLWTSLISCLLYMLLSSVTMIAYSSTVRSQLAFIQMSYRSKLKLFFQRFCLTMWMLFPSILLEAIHFFPLWVEKYYYNNHSISHNWLLGLILWFNACKLIFLKEVVEFVHTDFRTMLLRWVCHLFACKNKHWHFVYFFKNKIHNTQYIK